MEENEWDEYELTEDFFEYEDIIVDCYTFQTRTWGLFAFTMALAFDLAMKATQSLI